MTPDLHLDRAVADHHTMLVMEWMTRSPVTLEPGDPVACAAELMARRNVRRIPVVDAGKRLVGIVTKSDVLRSCPSNLNPFSSAGFPEQALASPIREIMSRSPVTVSGDSPIELAAQVMLQHRIGGLPVLLAGALTGIITESDIFRAFSAALGSGEGGVRITFGTSSHDDPFAFVMGLASRHGMRVGSVASYEHDGRRTAVVRLVGKESPQLLDELWTKGHRVLSVLRLNGAPAPVQSPAR